MNLKVRRILMKNLFRPVSLLSLTVLFFFLGCATAERFEPGYQPVSDVDTETYNVNTVISFEGMVSGVTGFDYEEGLSVVTLIVEDMPNNKRYAVQLGPAWFLTLLGASYEEGDMVAVQGSKLNFLGEEVEEEEEEEEEEKLQDIEYYLLLARKIKKNDKTIYVRSKSGKPKWYRKGRMLGIEKNIGSRRDLRKQIPKSK
jgi:hypothetical protein